MPHPEAVTLVTGIFDVGRGSPWKFLGSGFRRNFEFYTKSLKCILEFDLPMVVYIEKKNESLVREARGGRPTRIVVINREDLEDFPFYEEIQRIRTSKAWRSQAKWLGNSPQGQLALYNPLVLSKLYWLHEESQLNVFRTPYFVWLDGGILSHFSRSLRNAMNEKVFNHLTVFLDKFFVLTYPYHQNTEIHGFERQACARYCRTDFVDRVCRGGLLGGSRASVEKVFALYDAMLRETLRNGFMGTEESILTILSFRFPELFHVEPLPTGDTATFFARMAGIENSDA